MPADDDLTLIGRALLLSLSLLCQRAAAMFGRAGLYFEARYWRMTEVAHG